MGAQSEVVGASASSVVALTTAATSAGSLASTSSFWPSVVSERATSGLAWDTASIRLETASGFVRSTFGSARIAFRVAAIAAWSASRSSWPSLVLPLTALVVTRVDSTETSATAPSAAGRARALSKAGAPFSVRAYTTTWKVAPTGMLRKR